MKDPPAFESDYDYTSFFNEIEDSLNLHGNSSLISFNYQALKSIKGILILFLFLWYSNLITAKDYESYFTRIYFDAKIELKKQRGKDEKRMEEENNKDDDSRGYDYSSSSGNLSDYAVWLMPFYDSKPGVADFLKK